MMCCYALLPPMYQACHPEVTPHGSMQAAQTQVDIAVHRWTCLSCWEWTYPTARPLQLQLCPRAGELWSCCRGSCWPPPIETAWHKSLLSSCRYPNNLQQAPTLMCSSLFILCRLGCFGIRMHACLSWSQHMP